MGVTFVMLIGHCCRSNVIYSATFRTARAGYCSVWDSPKKLPQDITTIRDFMNQMEKAERDFSLERAFEIPDEMIQSGYLVSNQISSSLLKIAIKSESAIKINEAYKKLLELDQMTGENYEMIIRFYLKRSNFDLALRYVSFLEEHEELKFPKALYFVLNLHFGRRGFVHSLENYTNKLIRDYGETEEIIIAAIKNYSACEQFETLRNFIRNLNISADEREKYLAILDQKSFKKNQKKFRIDYL